MLYLDLEDLVSLYLLFVDVETAGWQFPDQALEPVTLVVVHLYFFKYTACALDFIVPLFFFVHFLVCLCSGDGTV